MEPSSNSKKSYGEFSYNSPRSPLGEEDEITVEIGGTKSFASANGTRVGRTCSCHTILFHFEPLPPNHRFIIPLLVLGAVYVYRSWKSSSSPGIPMSFVETAMARELEEKKDDSMVDPMGDLKEDQNILESVESADVEPEQKSAGESIWKKILDSMNPAVCLAPATACSHVLLDDEIIEYNNVVPPMLRDIQHPGKSRTTALQKLYRFTDKEHQKNRVPVVCSTRYHTVDTLIPCLRLNASAQDRRQALLVLNNLCIPSENKRTILLGPSRDGLLPALLAILRQKLPESHLVVACIFNLSFYEETKRMLFQYVPTVALKHADEDTPEEYNFSQPTEKKDSMLRILERITSQFVPYYVKHIESVMYDDKEGNKRLPKSVEASTLRWTFCLLRNLSTDPDHASLLATSTKFPAAALEILKATAAYTDLALWSHDSLPEACLVFWVWLVQASDEACRHLQRQFDDETDVSAIKILKPITEQPGIQGVRARMVSSRVLAARDSVTSEDMLRNMASF